MAIQRLVHISSRRSVSNNASSIKANVSTTSVGSSVSKSLFSSSSLEIVAGAGTGTGGVGFGGGGSGGVTGCSTGFEGLATGAGGRLLLFENEFG